MRIAVVFLSVLVLTGCVGSDPPVTPAPTPTSTPLFASDAEALKAAEAAYKLYIDTSAAILSDGGSGSARIDAVAVSQARKAALDGAKSFRTKGLREVGVPSFDSTVLQHFDRDDHTTHDVVGMYVCLDVTGVDVVDGSGASVVLPTRPNRQGFEASFDLSKSRKSLIISSRTPWSGVEGC